MKTRNNQPQMIAMKIPYRTNHKTVVFAGIFRRADGSTFERIVHETAPTVGIKRAKYDLRRVSL